MAVLTDTRLFFFYYNPATMLFIVKGGVVKT